MRKRWSGMIGIAVAGLLAGCGGGGGSSSPDTEARSAEVGYYLDSAVAGVSYVCGAQTGTTDGEGKFLFEPGKSCTFKLAGIELREIVPEELVPGVKIVEDKPEVAALLQSLDNDGDPSNGITIEPEVVKIVAETLSSIPTADELVKVVTQVQNEVAGFRGRVVTPEEAAEHVEATKTQVTKSLLAGKTFYLVSQETDDGSIGSGTVWFNADATSVTWKDDEDASEDGTSSIEVVGNRILWPEDDSWTLVGPVYSDYIALTDYSSDGRVASHMRLYTDRAKAQAYRNRLERVAAEEAQKLKALLAGKSFYLEDGTQYVFNPDMSQLQILHADGTTQNRPIEININGVHFLDGSGVEYLLTKEATGGYLLVENAEVTEGGVIISHNGTFKLYYEAPGGNTGFTHAMLDGKTYYYVAYDDFGYEEIGERWNMARMSFTSDSVTFQEYDTPDTSPHTFGYDLEADGSLRIHFPEGVDAIVLVGEGPKALEIRVDGDTAYMFYNEADARAFLEKAQQELDLESILPGRTMYLHCGDGNDTWIETVGFLPDNIMAETKRGGEEEKGTYEIEGNTVYTEYEDEPREAHVAIYYDGKKIVFSEEDHTTTTFYFTEADARNSAPMDCTGGDDEVEVENSGLVSGQVLFYDENNRTIGAPEDAWIRITPTRYQNDGDWHGVDCHIAPDGSFGSVCYIDIDAEAMRAAFDDSSERFQAVVYKNHIDPERHHWEDGEKVYKFVGSDLPYGAWDRIEIYPGE